MSKREPARAPAIGPVGDDGSIEARDPLDHDGDRRKGGSAPTPERQHLVMLEDSPAHGVRAGEVVSAPAGLVRELLAGEQARNATDAEVERAQPRVRILSA